MKKGIKIGVITLLLLLTGCTIGGSFSCSIIRFVRKRRYVPKMLTPILSCTRIILFCVPGWIVSIRLMHFGTLFVLNPEGIRLHAYYIAAPQPTKKTAVIVHGYTDNAIRMFMIGYLYNHDLQYNVLLPDLQHQGRVVVPPSRWAGKTAWT